MKKLAFVIAVTLGLLATIGSASAATLSGIDQATSTISQLQPASSITYNEELVVNNTGRFNSVYIGKQGTGGVTFFNGTIVNSTTNDGVDNPVTFGDNVRIDGRVFRGLNYGPGLGDDMPFIINDDVQITGTLTLANNSDDTSTVTVGDITSVLAGDGISVSNGSSGDAIVSVADGGINTARLADDAVTGDKIADNSNITAASYSYNSAQTRYLSVSGYGFIPNNETDTYAKASGVLSTTDDSFSSPVDFPNGAIITGMTVDYYNNVPDENMNFALARSNNKSTTETIASIVPTTNLGSWREASATSISNAIIDNSQYSYYIFVNFSASSADMRLGGVTISYTVDNPLP